jgi:hypothetical protein
VGGRPGGGRPSARREVQQGLFPAVAHCERFVNRPRRVASARTVRPPAVAPWRAMERQQEYVLRTVEERGVRLIRLWFTDVLGPAQVGSPSPRPSSRRLREGMHFDGSAIDGFSRVQESDVLARPDPNTFELLPWGRPRRAPRPACSATSRTSTAPPSRATPARCCAQPRPRPATAASRSTWPPRWSSSTSPTATPGPAEPLDTARTSTSPPPTSPTTCASAPSTCSRRWASRSSTRSTRTAPASTRSTCATPTRSPWPTTS